MKSLDPGKRKWLWFDLAILILLPFVVFNQYLRFGIPLETITADSLRVWSGNGTPVFDFLSSIKVGHGIPTWSFSFSRPHFHLTSELAPLFQTLIQAWTRDITFTIKLDTFIHMVVGSLGMYFLSRMLFRNAVAALISAALYPFLPYNISYLQAEMGRAWGPMLAPFSYLLLIRLIWRPSLKLAFISAIVFGLALLGHPENFFLNGLFLLFTTVLIFLIRPKLGSEQIRPLLVRAGTYLSLVLILFLAIWGFHLFFSVLHDNPYTAVESVDNWLEITAPPSPEAVRQSQNLFTALTLQHWEWRVTPVTHDYPPRFEWLWIIPFLVSLGVLIRKRREPWVWILFAIAFMSLWMVLGTKVSPSLFTWCHYHLPKFSLDRHSNRFLFHFCMVVTLSFGWVLGYLFMKWSRGHELIARTLAYAILTPFLIAGHYQGTQYNFTFIPVERPAYVEALHKWFSEHNTTDHRVINGSGVSRLETIHLKTHFFSDELLLRFYAQPYFADLLADMGFKYIMLGDRPQDYKNAFGKQAFLPDRADDEVNRDDVMEYLSNHIERTVITKRLLKNPDFIAHRPQGTRDIVVFENKKAFDGYELYPGTGVLVLGGPGAYAALSYDFMKPKGLARLIPVFLAQHDNVLRAHDLEQTSSVLLFHNTSPFDLWASQNLEKLRFLSAFDARPKDWELWFRLTGLPQFNPAFPRLDHGFLNQMFGNLVYSRFAMTTKGSGKEIIFDVEVNERSRQEIFLRAFHTPFSGDVTFKLNGEKIKTVSLRQRMGFWWISLGSHDFQVGSNQLVMKTGEGKLFAIDGVLIESHERVQSGISEAVSRFSDLKDAYLLGPNRFFPISQEAAGSWVSLRRRGRYFLQAKSTDYFDIYIDGAACSLDQPLELERGPHEIVIRGAIRGFQSLMLIEEGLSIPEVLHDFEYSREGADVYQFQAKADRPFLLMQPETYFSGWKGDWGSGSQMPVISHLFMNAYPILKEGLVEGRIIYRNKILFGFSLLSLFTVLALSGFLFWRRWRKGSS
jgi:hypothetical protein